MLRKKLVRLVLLTSVTTVAIGGCGGGWVPWIAGAGLIAWLTQQQAG